MIVVDTTVLADFLVGDEKLKERAQALIGQDPLWIAPSLWRYELGNVLWKWVQFSGQGNTLSKEAMAIAESLLEETIEDLDWTSILMLASKCGFTYYDSSYVWLAKALDIPLATRDRKILKQFPQLVVSF